MNAAADTAVPARSSLAVADLAADADPAPVFAGLPDRDLDQDQLLRLAATVATRPGLWDDDVAFDDIHRHFACLHRDEHVDVWLLCWTPSNDTGWHDHDVSSGAVAVVRGRLLEHTLSIGGPDVGTTVDVGRAFSFGPDHIHRLTGAGPGRAVSVHAYSPPLRRLGQYEVDADGVLHRVSMPYTDELRAAEVGAA